MPTGWVFENNRLKLLYKEDLRGEFSLIAVKAIELIHSYSGLVDQTRAKHPRAYELWTADEEQRLVEAYASGTSPEEIAQQLERQPSAIRSRLRKLGYELPGEPRDDLQDYIDIPQPDPDI